MPQLMISIPGQSTRARIVVGSASKRPRHRRPPTGVVRCSIRYLHMSFALMLCPPPDRIRSPKPGELSAARRLHSAL
jgi:hypothetical protein